MKAKSQYLIIIIIVSSILLTSVAQSININHVYAQLGQLNQAQVIFRNVVVDTNPVPNKPFKVNATIFVSSILPRHVLLSINTPDKISVTGSNIVDLGGVSSGDSDRTVSWTLTAAASGSFPLNVTAYSSSISISNTNNNFESTSFPFVVSIGSLGYSLDIRPSTIYLAGSILTSSSLGPGDKNLPLNITLVNDGTLPLVNVSSVLQLSEPFFWSYKENGTTSVETHSETFRSGSLANGQFSIAPYYISVRNSATPDTYISHLRISFSDGKQQHQITYSIPISVSSNTAVSIIAHVARLIPDYYTPISFDIVNKGEVPLHAIQLSSTSGADAPLSPYYTIGTPYWIGDLAVGESKNATIQVYIPHETLTQQPLPITLSYEANGKHSTETHLIGVQIQGNPAFQIHNIRVTPSLTFPGDVNTRVDVNILNAGYGIANNVSTVLKFPRGLTPAFGNADTEYFGRITPNQNFTASYFLNINSNTTSGSYPITILTTYYNSKNDNGKASLDANFLVSPKAKFDLVGVVNSDQLYRGATNVPLQVTLRNTGTAIAQTITAKFLGGNTIPGVRSPLETAIGNTENIGTIPPGQVFTTTFIVNLDSSSTVAGTQAASIDFTWTQTQTSGTSTINTFTQTVPILYHVAEGPNYLLYYDGIPWTYVAIAGIIAMLIIIFLIKRRRRIDNTTLYLERQRESGLSQDTLKNITRTQVSRDPIRNHFGDPGSRALRSEQQEKDKKLV